MKRDPSYENCLITHDLKKLPLLSSGNIFAQK